MKKKTTIITTVLIVLVSLIAEIGVADARVRQGNGRFVFAPFNNNKDPMNLLQIGGQSGDEICHFQDGQYKERIARTTRCFGSHLGTAWKFNGRPRGSEMKERSFVKKCNGPADLRYAGVRNAVPNTRSLSTSPTCKNQYHVRIWGDYPINRGAPDYPGEWSVAQAYYEERGFFSPVDGETKGDHKVVQDWETTEGRVLHQMKDSEEGESRYCVQPDYRPVPGQIPGRDRRGLYNNGRISRVSVQKYAASVQPPRSPCAGA